MIYFRLQGYGYLLRNQKDDYAIFQQLSNNHQMLILELLPWLTWFKSKLQKKTSLHNQVLWIGGSHVI